MKLELNNFLTDLSLIDSQKDFIMDFNNSRADVLHRLEKYREYYISFKKDHDKNTHFFFYMVNIIFTEKQKNVIREYYDYGFGIKTLAKELCISYTKTRHLLSALKIDMRKGFRILTEPLKERRKEKALHEKLTQTGWRNPNIIRKELTGIRGIQGYYFNKSFNKYVWLRSTYEYIYAIWLDYHNVTWDVEVKLYNLADGTTYRPDFFIFENDSLIKIVEMKGYYIDKTYKSYMLNDEIDNRIEVCTLNNDNKSIENYLVKHNSYSDALQEWKKIRTLKNEKNL